MASGTDGLFLPVNGTSVAFGSVYPLSRDPFIKQVYFERDIGTWSMKRGVTNLNRS